MIGTVPYEEAGRICNVLYIYFKVLSTVYRLNKIFTVLCEEA
jgi:hypothetical protein